MRPERVTSSDWMVARVCSCCSPERCLAVPPFLGRPGNSCRSKLQPLLPPFEVRCGRAHPMLHIEHRFLCFLEFDRQPRFQTFVFANEFLEPNDVFVKRGRFAN